MSPRFRPCIDLHQGRVKQIVGSTLRDDDHPATTDKAAAAPATTNNSKDKDELATNFETDVPPREFAQRYRKDDLRGGHVIMLGPGNEAAAKEALAAYPQGMQVGGGISAANAQEYLDAGASHVIVTSAVFRDGKIYMPRLEELTALVGKERLVLDLSCRRKPSDPQGPYYVVTDRWQKYTDFTVDKENLTRLAGFCNEFLVHGVDVEGKRQGILEDLVSLLGEHSPIPVTYAGGARSVEDMELVAKLGNGKVDVSVGSALDIFGGSLAWDKVVEWHRSKNPVIESPGKKTKLAESAS